LSKYKEFEDIKEICVKKTKELNQTWDIITKRLIEKTLTNQKSVKFSNKEELIDYTELLLKDREEWVKTECLAKLSDNSEFVNHLIKLKPERVDSFVVYPAIHYKKTRNHTEKGNTNNDLD